ncbi:hypothetical protein DAEQUDRAFT_670950 [Daedalea quercina L-15889]|uniref:Uncharacterized protein n=1 Tax=Daedalea quercina L-15889 TaxID=1314783 RepID=A0A165PVB0_9APHY|nr:hypothetical protein DAEQUDRAFT_670950 [Daedalea quercina L-15889]
MAKSTSPGWDPVLLISQIVAMQTLHYMTLAILIPPLLTIFCRPDALDYVGGAANVGMVMDWRELAGKPTTNTVTRAWGSWNSVWSGGKQVGFGGHLEGQWDGLADPRRGWIIAVCWLAASGADIYFLYTLIRRPRMILDFSVTLIFNHLVLTTYYAASFPTTLFFWGVMIISAAMMVILAEQLCVKREMTEGLAVAAPTEDEDVELGSLLRRD